MRITTKILNAIALSFALFAPTVAAFTFYASEQIAGRALLGVLDAPTQWSSQASADERMTVPGREIVYYAKPDARYSRYATRGAKKPRAIVVHFTSAKTVAALVRYGHLRDFSRGGASFGYHFYIGRDGRIVQGAPLSKRTNHIKSPRRRERTATARHLWSGNTIGVSLVGGCDRLLRPNTWWRPTTCTGEYVTRRQVEAGRDLVAALQARFGIACRAIYGHGDLQTDRETFEGRTLKTLVRRDCRMPPPTRRPTRTAESRNAA
ncbi:MAG: peptidoglycan recognition family protein [Pseudomonadota bacterium]